MSAVYVWLNASPFLKRLLFKTLSMTKNWIFSSHYMTLYITYIQYMCSWSILDTLCETGGRVTVCAYLLSCWSQAQEPGFCVMVNRVSEMSDRRQSRSNMWASTGAASGSWCIWLFHFSSLDWHIWPCSTSAQGEQHCHQSMPVSSIRGRPAHRSAKAWMQISALMAFSPDWIHPALIVKTKM